MSRGALRVIISPAKKMVEGSESFAVRDVPAAPEKTTRLLDALASMDAAELQRLWQVSDRLLGPCLETLGLLAESGIPASADDLADPAFSSRVSPAVFAYVGLQYQSMAPAVMDEAALAWLQGHLRILSGFYGCVRPFDAVLPYRLEMGARLAVGGASDLYGYWGRSIAEAVCEPAGGGAVTQVVNLASVEYARAALPHLPAGVQATTCVFAELVRNGKPVQRATASKTARGSMVRWMAERDVRDASELEAFDVGYRLAPELSARRADGSAETLVFVRGETGA